jgi:hypothetical protein
LPQNLIDFFHDGAQDLVELQGRCERFAELVEYRDFVGGFDGDVHTRSSAPFDALEGPRVRGAPHGVFGDAFGRVIGF